FYRTRHNKTESQIVLDAAYELLKRIPLVEQELTAKLDDYIKPIGQQLMTERQEMPFETKMPEVGKPVDEILKAFGILKNTSLSDLFIFEENEEKQFQVEEGDGQDSG